MAKKQHLDDFLRDKLDQLPNAPAAGFEKVEGKMQAKSHRGILVLMLIPILLSGLYWMSTLNESDLYPGSHPEVNRGQETVPALAIEIPEVVVAPSTKLVNPIPVSSGHEATQVKPASKAPTLAVVSTENQNKVTRQSTESPPQVENAVEVNSAEPSPVIITNDNVSEPEAESNIDKPGTEVEDNIPGNEIIQTESTEDDFSMFVFSASQTAVDQEDLEDAFKEVDVRETSPWSVTLNVYPNYTFRDFSIKSGYEDMVNDRYETIINESEKGGFAFNVGLDVRYHIGNNVFLGSGLGYIQMKVNGNYDFLIFGEPVIDDHGAIEQFKAFAKPIQINRGIVQNYNFLQIPLHVSYQPWVSKKVRMIVEGGFSYIYFLGAEGTTIDYQTLAPKDLSTESFNKNLASLDFKVGATYMISESIGVGLEPTLMYFSGSIYPEDHPVHVVPWSVGLNINLRMRLY